MKRVLLCLASLCAASPAWAVDKIYTPYVSKGEWEVEYFGSRSVDKDNAKDNGQGHEASIGYGVNDWWKTELVGTFEKEPQSDTDFHSAEWENIFQFTKKGEYWVDSGALLTYEWTPESGEADHIEAKLLFAKDVGKTFHILNLTGEKEVGDGQSGSVQGGLTWSSRYRLTPFFEPGFEVHSEFGELNDAGSLDDHEQYIGPVAYGTIPLEMEGDDIEGIGYRAGYLFGLSNAASDGQMVLQLEYELEF